MTSKKNFRFEDGNLIIPSGATVHECMDFMHTVKEDCKDAPIIGVRWKASNSLVRSSMNKKNNEFKIKMTSGMQLVRPVMYATVNRYGVGQYGAGTAKASQKLDAAITLDQKSSNFFFALLHASTYDASNLKKSVWSSTETEDHINEEQEKTGKPVDPREFLRAKGFGFHPIDQPLPLNAPLIETRLALWVYSDKSVPEAERPRKSIGSSLYGGPPYVVVNGTITSGFVKFMKPAASDYIKRIDKDGNLRIQKGDLANMCIRFTTAPSFYASGQSGDSSFPNAMLWSIKLGTFDVTCLAKTANAGGAMETTADDMESMREMGAILSQAAENAEDGGESDDGELSEHSREVKRQRTE